MKAEIVLRPYRIEDRHFVTDSFLRSFGRSAYGTGISGRVIIDLLEPFLVLWNVVVAATPDDTEALGWLCHDGTDRVAWMYVKPYARRAGVARALLEHAKVHRVCEAPFVPTKLFDKPFHEVTRAKGYAVRFRPFLGAELTAAASAV